jgi:Protein involved in propanediol utilization, and related proteins (includes coumermycin biosynthetic protein), possible kinase
MIYKDNYITEVEAVCHHGEIMQGIFEGNDGSLHRGLVTLKCNLYTSTAIFIKEGNKKEIEVIPKNKKKALEAAQNTLKYIGMEEKFGGYLILKSNIPEELGFGSSTSNVIASIQAVANSFDVSLSATEIAKISVDSEKASDGIMFNECVLFAQREGKLINTYGTSFPDMHVIGFNDNYKKGVNTLNFEPAKYSHEEIKTFKVLKGLFEYGMEQQDPELIGSVATASAKINQNYLIKPNFNKILKIAQETKSLGVQVAHSGSIIGFLYRYDIDIKEKYNEVKPYLTEIGITNAWYFNTKGMYV